MKKNKDIIFINSDIDIENMDIMPLDTRVKHEYDKAESFSLSPSGLIRKSMNYDTLTLLSSDTPSLSPSGPIRGARNDECRIEAGRSMVEMLGTLAIIGVLSISGIMLYSYAMDKYRANQTMRDVTLRGIDVLAQFDRTGDANLNEWQNEKTIYPITLEEDTIGIQVDEVPERVCDMMAEGMKNTATAIKINSAYIDEDSGDCGEDNSLVFYFDDNPIEDEGNINEPVREQCGETLCEQCFKCDKSTMTCISVMDELYESADNVDDFRICASNGYKSYCGLLGDGCAELGSANCAGMGDPDCVAYIDGSCQLLDSTMFVQNGFGGFRCTKNGQDGYCYNGVCRATGPEGEACIGKADEETCEVSGQTGICFYGFCMAPCSNDMETCDAFGKKGVCADGLCGPLTDDGCSVTFAGQTIPLPNEFSFACEKDGKTGICLDGGCATEKCGETYCGQCFECDESTNTCVPIITIEDLLNPNFNLDDWRICTSNGYQSYCGMGENGGCAIMGVCGGDPECNIAAGSECQPLDSRATLELGLGGFQCTKNGKDGYCMQGICEANCTSNSDCKNTERPFCNASGVCGACSENSHCGDTVSDYCSYGSCNTCSSSTPYWDAEKYTCEECLENSHCTDATEPFCNNGTCSCTDDSQCLDETIPYCVNRKCVACTSHSQCGAKQYCGDSNASCEKAQLGGACHDLDYTAHTITYTDTSGVSKTETFYVFKKPMTWWDTVSACKALGNKDLLSVTDLITEEDGSTWQGDTGTHTTTDLAQKLDNKVVAQDLFGNNYIWTSTTKDSCRAYTVRLVDGYSDDRRRDWSSYIIASHYAVCR